MSRLTALSRFSVSFQRPRSVRGAHGTQAGAAEGKLHFYELKLHFDLHFIDK
jgi:hypothetical protein